MLLWKQFRLHAVKFALDKILNKTFEKVQRFSKSTKFFFDHEVSCHFLTPP